MILFRLPTSCVEYDNNDNFDKFEALLLYFKRFNIEAYYLQAKCCSCRRAC